MLLLMAYPGGKGRAYQRIISLMPPHVTYVETHLGGGSVLRHKRPALRTIGVEIDAAVIEWWRALALPGLELVHGCAVNFLRQFSFSGNELVYVDPPYWPDSRKRSRCYRHDYTREHHLELLDTIKELPCRVMISGYASKAYDEALRGWGKHIILNQTQTGPAEEMLWTNFQPDHRLHDYTYVGNDFRDRERIKRSRQTQIERLRRAPPVERAAMLSDIVDTFTDDVLAIAERVR